MKETPVAWQGKARLGHERSQSQTRFPSFCFFDADLLLTSVAL
jgi:hypothetical protein